jgi:hypothetical protein
MHGQQAGGLIHRKTAIGSRSHVKMGYARVFFTEEEDIAVGDRTGG